MGCDGPLIGTPPGPEQSGGKKKRREAEMERERERQIEMGCVTTVVKLGNTPILATGKRKSVTGGLQTVLYWLILSSLSVRIRSRSVGAHGLPAESRPKQHDFF